MMDYETNLLSKRSGKFEPERLDYLNDREFNWKKANTTSNNNNTIIHILYNLKNIIHFSLTLMHKEIAISNQRTLGLSTTPNIEGRREVVRIKEGRLDTHN